ncbi:hypothetical protein AVEN_157679-1 [Araneus ventricosus]|uniref:Uncharacterized protein n=1 Tax=Araneus ventricosus TaxID=182803 RepID=A0A4Y2J4C5_ARAVE|nr:hypothetical protein AVEN_157679-1 [Araneus ventricosus]
MALGPKRFSTDPQEIKPFTSPRNFDICRYKPKLDTFVVCRSVGEWRDNLICSRHWSAFKITRLNNTQNYRTANPRANLTRQVTGTGILHDGKQRNPLIERATNPTLGPLELTPPRSSEVTDHGSCRSLRSYQISLVLLTGGFMGKRLPKPVALATKPAGPRCGRQCANRSFIYTIYFKLFS